MEGQYLNRMLKHGFISMETIKKDNINMDLSLMKMDVALWNGLNWLRLGPVVKLRITLSGFYI